jgi:type I restriction enzyme M protein
MARAKKEVKEQPVEQALWASADKLRKNMDAAEYKHIVLGLIFLKYISDNFYELYHKLEAGEGDYAGSDPNDPYEYRAENVFYVPPQARWDYLQGRAKLSSIGKDVDDAMDAIEKDNPSLKGVLPKEYAKEKLDKQSLGGLIDIISTIALGDSVSRSNDVLGRVYEYFLGQFALAEGKKGGQFYTPRCVVQLLVEMLEPYEGRVFDPCCGSGGMFVQSEKFIEAHADRYNGKAKEINKLFERVVSIYGQESNQTTWRLCKMNLALRGIDSSNVKWNNEGSFLNDAHPDLRADFVIANPPFNDGDWSGELLRTDGRWKYGVPPENNANYAWIQHFLYHLSPKGKVGLVLANTALSIESEAEFSIRKKIIEADLVECVIALPAKLFYSTKIEVCLWFFNRDKRQKGETLFIDARTLGEYVNRTLKEFTNDDITRIASTAHTFFGGDGYTDIPNFCKVATTEQIVKKNFNLSPTKYVSSTLVSSGDSDLKIAEQDLASNLESVRSEITQLVAVFGERDSSAISLRLPDFSSMSGEELAELTDRMSNLSQLQKTGANLAITYSEALFRSWFIDFAFPNDDGLPYRDSGGAMKDTAYGSVPEQWDVIQLGSILQIRNEKVGDREDVPEYSTTNRGVHLRSENFSKTITNNSAKNKLAYNGDLIFGMSREILNFGVMTDEVGGVSPAYHVYEIDDTKMNPEFLEVYMRLCDSYFLSLIKPGAREGQVLDKNEVQSKLILCPPLDLQNQYMLMLKYLSRYALFGV